MAKFRQMGSLGTYHRADGMANAAGARAIVIALAICLCSCGDPSKPSAPSTGGTIVADTDLELWEDLQDFASACGSSCVLEGNLNVQASVLLHLNGLQGLERVTGSVNIANNEDLSDIDALSGLVGVDGNLRIHANSALASLGGLSSLQRVGGDLRITVSPMRELLGLEALEVVEGEMEVSRNFLLRSLAGLQGLERVESHLSVDATDSLLDVSALEKLTFVGGDLLLRNHLTLPNLDGLHNMTHVGGDVSLIFNSGLTSIAGLRGMSVVHEIRGDPQLLGTFLAMDRSMGWTEGAVAASGWLDWVSQIPLEHRETLPDGTRLLAVHASPGTDEGHGLTPHLSHDELGQAFGDCDAGLVFVGHTHWQMEVDLDGTRIVNLGSLSNPQPPDLRAKSAILSADASGHSVELCQVEYDRDAVIASLHDRRHPGVELISSGLRGENCPHWFKDGACVIMVDGEERITMQLRDDKAGMRGADCWGLFGGFMEPGETPEQTVVRELREELEAELEPARLELMTVYPTPSGIKSRVFTYRLEGELKNAVLHEGQRYDLVARGEIDAGQFQGKTIVPYQLALMEQFWTG